MDITKVLNRLFETGWVETSSRVFAVALWRAARAAEAVGGITALRGGSFNSEDDGSGEPIYYIECEPPFCDGGCGDKTQSPTGMCFQCQCEAHAAGWYSMDLGKARCGLTDAQVHAELDFNSRVH